MASLLEEAAITIFKMITHKFTEIEDYEGQHSAYHEIKILSKYYLRRYGCDASNRLLDDIMNDRRGARSLLTPKHRCATIPNLDDLKC